jgi:uncharacterized protein YggE
MFPAMSEQTGTSEVDVIEVFAEHEDDVAAESVDLFVDVDGASLVTGRAALNKAREVHQLVESLAVAGVAEDQIFVESIQASTTSGMFSKSSSARYSLRIACRNLERLGDVLGAITSQKNVRLGNMEWGYDESPAASARRLAACAGIAMLKARAVAEALGVRLGPAHQAREVTPKLPEPVPFGAAPGGFARAARASVMSQEDLGLSVSHHKKVVTRLLASFRVLAQ